MTFFQLWLTGYTHPVRFVDEIRAKPAPYWGISAQLIFLSPLVLIAEMLLQVAFVHMGLRLAGCRGDFDQLLNVVGMSALIVGAVLIPWDWFWTLTGWGNQIFLGVSHLVISLWAALITFLALRRMFGAPAWLALLLVFLGYPVGMPIAMMFMRSPV